MEFRVSSSGGSPTTVFTGSTTGYITLDDVVTVVSNKTGTYTFDELEIYFYTPGTGGFFGSPSKSTYAEIPPERYQGKEFFMFKPSEFFTSDQIHGTLTVSGTTSYGGEVSGTPLIYNFADGVHIDKYFFENVELDTSINITTDTGSVIDTLTVILNSGGGDLEEELRNPSIFKKRISDANNLDDYTFTIADLDISDYQLKNNMYYEVEVTTQEKEIPPPIEVPYTEDFINVYSNNTQNNVGDEIDNVKEYSTLEFHYFDSIEVIEEYSTGNVSNEIALDSERETTVTLDLSEYLNHDLIGLTVKARASKLTTSLFYDTVEDVSDPLEAEVKNATVYPESSSQVNDDTVITITADTGLVIDDPFTLHIDLHEELHTGGTIKVEDKIHTIYPDNEENAKYFNEDKTTVRVPLADFWEVDYYTYPPERIRLYGVVGSERTLSNGFVSNFATIFKMDRESLDTFTNSLLDISSGAYLDSIYNKVHSIFMIPFKLPSYMLSEEPRNITNYTAGSTDAINAKAPYLLDNKYILPLGAIDVEGAYNNVYDFKDTQAYLHAPYVEQPILVDPTYAINETITLNMAIDLYNGNATLNIHSSKIDGELVQRENIPIKHEIPLMSRGYNVIEGEIGGFIYNQVTTPFIEVTRNIPYENNSMFGKEMSEYGIVGDYIGYLEMHDTNVKTDATTQEQTMINSQLIDGVIIKNPTDSQPLQL